MASTTVIDKLIVELGLDPKNFTKGQKQAAAGLKELRNEAKDTAKETSTLGDQLTRTAVKLGLWSMLLKGFKRSAEAILDASRATRQLGFDSRNYDIAADKLRNFENVAKTFGGTAEGVLKTVAGIQRAVFNLSFNGQMSDQLVQLGRLGVAFQDSRGHARDFKDIYLDTADAIQKQVSSGRMTEGEAMAFLQSAGISDEGLARAALGGRSGAYAAYEQQTYNRQISATDIAKANSIELQKTKRDISRQALGVESMENTDKLLEGFYNLQDAMFQKGMEWVPKAAAAIDSFFGKISWLFGGSGGASDAAGGPSWKDRVISFLGVPNGGGTRSDRNNNPGNLQDAAGNFRSFATPEEGMAAAQRQLGLYRGRGNNTIRGIIGKWNPPGAPGNSRANYEAYVADVAKQSGINPDAPTTSADDAAILAAMFNHEGSARRYDAAGVADVLSMQREAASGAVGAAHNTTTVQIDSITVHTQATDANGIAGSIADATRRKFITAQADQGMR